MDMTKELVLDCEIYPNYFLAAFGTHDNKYSYVELKGEEAALDRTLRSKLHGLMSRFVTFGFNSNNFDIPLILMALKGGNVSEIYALANAIIKHGVPSWKSMADNQLRMRKEYSHFDLIEPAPAIKISLKVYGGRMGSKQLQDLPIEPGTVLTETQMQEIKDYSGNDLRTTWDLRRAIAGPLKLRSLMSKEHGIDLRSKSDAQMAEAIILQGVEKETGGKVARPLIPDSVSYKVPDFIKFRTGELQEILETIRKLKFEIASNGAIKLPEVLADYVIGIGQSKYKLGIGGLHSQESSQVVVEGEGFTLRDRDVTSYYPNIIRILKLFPPQMGAAFLKVYVGIIERRVNAKREAGVLKAKIREGDKSADTLARFVYIDAVNEALKICLNGSFGKLGSAFSRIYAPDLMLTVTLTGQLSLLMLIESLELAGITVVSGNTDGFVSKVPDGKYELYDSICNDWEERTGFNLEETVYSGLYSRDVNNYFAVMKNGDVKGKGIFAEQSLRKSPSLAVVSDAVIAHMTKGVPFMDTLIGCQDIKRFLIVRTVRGGARWCDEEMGRVVRWAYCYGGAPIYYGSNGHLVPKSDAATPMQLLPDEMPWDIDYERYVTECEALYKTVTGHPFGQLEAI